MVANHIAQAQFTTYVSHRKPVDNVKRLDTGYGGVYFFTDIRGCKGCKIVHEWWHNGTLVGTVKGKVKTKTFRWWSRKTLTPNMTGDWTVKVFLDGREVMARTVRYQKISAQQGANRNIEQRMQMQESSECELQLRYFSGQVQQHPNDGYFKFMLDKWTKRCLPE